MANSLLAVRVINHKYIVVERGKKMLKGKTVILAVTGSIAAYKIASLASALKKMQADVHVLMTKNAENLSSDHFEHLNRQ